MKKLLTLTACCLMAFPALAEDISTAPAKAALSAKHEKHGFKPLKDRTLPSEISFHEQRLAELKKMTPEQYEAEKKQKMEQREKWKRMSFQERKAAREKNLPQ